MNLALIKDADNKAKQSELYREIQKWIRRVKGHAAGKDEEQFAMSMQAMISKVGLLVSDLVLSVKLKRDSANLLEALDYLCLKILEDKRLYFTFMATLVNDAANDAKHRKKKNNSINMNECMGLYNRLINQLNSKLKLPSFKALVIPQQNNKPKPAVTKQTQPVQPRPTLNPTEPLYNRTAYDLPKIVDTTKTVLRDSTGTVEVDLCGGDGYNKKGFGPFKKDVLHFKLWVKYSGPYEVKKIIAYTRCGSYDSSSTIQQGINEIVIEASRNAELKVRVKAIVKLSGGLRRREKELICAEVSRKFS